MRNSSLYALIAKLALKGGFDFERDSDFTDDERGYIRQGLNDLEFFQPGFREKVALVQAGTQRKSGRQTKGV